MTYTTLFKDGIRSDVKTDIQARITHIGVGSGSTTPAASQTALVSEDFRDVVDDYDTSENDNIICSLRIGLTENNGNDITEVAGFNASSGGTMALRKLITTISKTSDIQVYLDLGNKISVTEVTL